MINSRVPGVIHACPYDGTVGFKNQKATRLLNEAFPKVIPNGLYKMLLRFHKKNSTMLASIQVMGHLNVS